MSEQEMPTEQELAEMCKRAEKATPGPWEAVRGQYGPQVKTEDGVFEGEIEYAVWACDDPQDGCMGIAAEWMNDATFIAHSRTDLPRLLNLVEAQRQEIERLRAEHEEDVSERKA